MKLQKLLVDSGFVFWEDESWGPGEGRIDWGCDYTEEFESFLMILANMKKKQIKKLFKQIKKNSGKHY